MRAEGEERLGLAAPVAAAADALPEGEDPHQLAVRVQGDGHHRLQGGQLARDLAGRGVRGAAPRLFDLDEAPLGREPQGKTAVRVPRQRPQPASPSSSAPIGTRTRPS